MMQQCIAHYSEANCQSCLAMILVRDVLLIIAFCDDMTPVFHDMKNVLLRHAGNGKPGEKPWTARNIFKELAHALEACKQL